LCHGVYRPLKGVVDAPIGQGIGCFESSRETTHRKPTYILDGIVHYAVSNMPGALYE
jgi:alanine dehydrogenase